MTSNNSHTSETMVFQGLHETHVQSVLDTVEIHQNGMIIRIHALLIPLLISYLTMAAAGEI